MVATAERFPFLTFPCEGKGFIRDPLAAAPLRRESHTAEGCPFGWLRTGSQTPDNPDLSGFVLPFLTFPSEGKGLRNPGELPVPNLPHLPLRGEGIHSRAIGSRSVRME